ncbi:bifunctional DNA primase/polymerase [Amycolatopsis sp. NPDC088138]|uniref:bifunctional DNA primase/polymerase n=1 Tax=Amycolatopsis sp. NPDC088138 TaxID=3363938 RepID=UPI0037FAFF16
MTLINFNGRPRPESPPCTRIPDVSGLTVPEAAVEYARHGIRVLPIDPATKHPGSILGAGWQDQASADPGRVMHWFGLRPLAGVGLVLGQSGLLVFDVDDADVLPLKLRRHLTRDDHPYQATRSNIPLRGHHVYRLPEGRKIGCPTRFLGAGWGEVKSMSGFIVAQPTPHTRPGGMYLWMRSGDVPELPAELAERLPEYNPVSQLSAGSAGVDEVRRFLDLHTVADRPGMLGALVRRAEDALGEGEPRHEVLVRVLPQALREASWGWYSAASALSALEPLFHRGGGNTAREWVGLQRHAVAAALADDGDERRREAEERLGVSAHEWRAQREAKQRGRSRPFRLTRDQAAALVVQRYSDRGDR